MSLVVESPTVKGCKMLLDIALSNLLELTLL